MLKMMGFPSEYIQGQHVFNSIGKILETRHYQNIAIIYDQAVEGQIFQKVTQSLIENLILYNSYKFPGECTYTVIDQLSENIAKCSPQAIIALGGGKALDTAKGVAKKLDTPIIICPTIASNDAPTSRLIIIYDENHKVQAVEKMQRNPDIVLVDIETIICAPIRFFAAGIGDAISKKFEANQCYKAGGLNSFGTPPLTTALLLADRTYDNLLTFGKKAFEDVKKQQISAEVECVIESTVLLSGLGFENGGLSLAHALIRGLTALPQFSLKLHGELVAYGTVVQAHLENRGQDFITELVKFLKSVELPTNLYELGCEYDLNENELNIITSLTLQNSYSKNFIPKITEQHLKKALIETNNFII